MNCLVDGKWLDVFQLKAPAGVTCLVFGALGLTEAWLGWLSLADTASAAWSIFLLFINAGVALLCGRAVDWVPAWHARQQRKNEKLQALNALTRPAHEILSYLSTKRTRSFLAPRNCPLVAQLVKAYLVDQQQGGTLDETPYLVRDYVWKELRRRRNAFRTDRVDGPPPWSARYDHRRI